MRPDVFSSVGSGGGSRDQPQTDRKDRPMSMGAVLKVDVVVDHNGIPTARVTSTGDATTEETRFQANQALAAYRLSQWTTPFPGGAKGLQIVEHGQSGRDKYVMVYRPERIL